MCTQIGWLDLIKHDKYNRLKHDILAWNHDFEFTEFHLVRQCRYPLMNYYNPFSFFNTIPSQIIEEFTTESSSRFTVIEEQMKVCTMVNAYSPKNTKEADSSPAAFRVLVVGKKKVAELCWVLSRDYSSSLRRANYNIHN